jgi:hypothetical protein
MRRSLASAGPRDGAVAALSPNGLEITAEAQILQSRSWAPPTLVGTTLYARDRREIAAFDLGR